MGSTLAGGIAGLALLGQVRWDGFPPHWGETAKLATAVVLILAGYLMYRPKAAPPVDDKTAAPPTQPDEPGK